MAQRVIGQLTQINLTPGKACAYVRVGEELFHLPMATRGFLQPDGTIALCTNGDRYNPLPPDVTIAIDLTVDSQGKNPAAGVWAPKLTKL